MCIFLIIELVNSKPTDHADCHDIMKQGYNTSGRYFIYPNDNGVPLDPVYVWCDMDTDGGGWTVSNIIDLDLDLDLVCTILVMPFIIFARTV